MDKVVRHLNWYYYGMMVITLVAMSAMYYVWKNQLYTPIDRTSTLGMVVQYFVNGLGVAYTSAYSACSKFINIFMSPAFTAGFTMSSFTSQNYGEQLDAARYHRLFPARR